MPLKALVESAPVYAWDMEEADRSKSFKCPHCPDDLILVLPTHSIIKHFRHKNNEAHGEPETPEHLAGKQFIVNCLKNVGFDAEPEVRIDGHICDVLAKVKHREIPIEFQCSPIAIDEYVDRINTYGDESRWLLGTHFFNHATTFKVVEKKYRDGDFMGIGVSDFYKKTYNIQRILKVEEMMQRQQPLFYLGNTHSLYLARWKYRLRSTVLGWYNLRNVQSSVFVEFVRGAPF